MFDTFCNMNYKNIVSFFLNYDKEFWLLDITYIIFSFIGLII